MRRPPLFFALLVCGCAPAFTRVALEPNLAAVGQPLQLLVTEFAYARHQRAFSFAATIELGMTVDVRNGTAEPLTIDTAAATLDVSSGCTLEHQHVTAVAAGLGPLPARAAAGKPTLTIGAGERRLVWLAFSDLERYPVDTRIILTLPRPGRPALAVTALEPTSCARPQPQRTVGAFGFTEALMIDELGSDTNLSAVAAGLWYGRGSWKAGLQAAGGVLFDRTIAGYERAGVFRTGLSLTWRPPLAILGLYATGHLTHAAFDASATVPARWSPGLTVGVEAPLQAGPVPVAWLRAGYMRILDDRAAHPNAVSLELDVRFWGE